MINSTFEKRTSLLIETFSRERLIAIRRLIESSTLYKKLAFELSVVITWIQLLELAKSVKKREKYFLD